MTIHAQVIEKCLCMYMLSSQLKDSIIFICNIIKVNMEKFNELFVVAWMLFGILLTPLFFIGFDLWAGIRKAKLRKEKITSEGWKRTIDKISRYYNMLLALIIVDCMQMSGIWYLDNFYDYQMPVFPFITMLGAMGVAAIEVKSILEQADEKSKKQIGDVTTLVTEIMKHKMYPSEMASIISEYINNKERKE